MQPISGQGAVHTPPKVNGSSSETQHTQEAEDIEEPDDSTQSNPSHSQSLPSESQLGQITTKPQGSSLPVLNQRSKQPEPTGGLVEAATNQVDLTDATQDQATSISRFSVTPPLRKTFQVEQRYAEPQVPSSSIWPSTLPFQTQISRPPTAESAGSCAQGRRPVSAGAGAGSALKGSALGSLGF